MLRKIKIIHSSTFRGPPAQTKSVYRNTEGVYRADELGPVNIETEHEGTSDPIQLPDNLPADTRAIYANKGPVVEANKIQGITMKSTYKK